MMSSPKKPESPLAYEVCVIVRLRGRAACPSNLNKKSVPGSPLPTIDDAPTGNLTRERYTCPSPISFDPVPTYNTHITCARPERPTTYCSPLLLKRFLLYIIYNTLLLNRRIYYHYYYYPHHLMCNGRA